MKYLLLFLITACANPGDEPFSPTIHGDWYLHINNQCFMHLSLNKHTSEFVVTHICESNGTLHQQEEYGTFDLGKRNLLLYIHDSPCDNVLRSHNLITYELSDTALILNSKRSSYIFIRKNLNSSNHNIINNDCINNNFVL